MLNPKPRKTESKENADLETMLNPKARKQKRTWKLAQDYTYTEGACWPRSAYAHVLGPRTGSADFLGFFSCSALLAKAAVLTLCAIIQACFILT